MKILVCHEIEYDLSNPYVRLLKKAYMKAGHEVICSINEFYDCNWKPDFIHIQWPEALYRWGYKLPKEKESIDKIRDRLKYFDNAGIPIVYTVHNLLPHDEASDFDRSIFRVICDYASIFVHHGSKSIAEIKKMFPHCAKSNHIICPHGPYDFLAVDPIESRKKYNLPQNKIVLLNLGLQKKYKGLRFVKKVAKQLSQKEIYLFIIGGGRSTSILGKIRRLIIDTVNQILPCYINMNSSVKSVSRKFHEDEVPYILSASDIVFLGHQKGTNSGVICLAASYKKAIVFPDIGNFKEQLLGWKWYETYEAGSIESASSAIMKMIERLNDKESDYDNKGWAERNSWEKHVLAITKALPGPMCEDSCRLD